MIDPWLVIWTVVIFTSIAWYAVLLFYVGWLGGRECHRMTKTLEKREEQR